MNAMDCVLSLIIISSTTELGLGLTKYWTVGSFMTVVELCVSQLLLDNPDLVWVHPLCLFQDHVMDQQSHLHPDDGDAFVLLDRLLLRLHEAVAMVMSRIRQRVIQSFVVLSFVTLLLFLAAFLYGSFYYAYMPKAAFSTPVHYHYRCVCDIFIRNKQSAIIARLVTHILSTGQIVNLLPRFPALTQWPTSPCSETENMCVYVWVRVQRFNCIHSKKNEQCHVFVLHFEVLTFGQAYWISLQIEMPESPTNEHLGMFMIKTTCFSQNQVQTASSVRSVRFSTCSPPWWPHAHIIKWSFVATSCKY